MWREGVRHCSSCVSAGLFLLARKTKEKSVLHIWKQPGFKMAEQEAMLTGTDFLTAPGMMKGPPPLFHSS